MRLSVVGGTLGPLGASQHAERLVDGGNVRCDVIHHVAQRTVEQPADHVGSRHTPAVSETIEQFGLLVIEIDLGALHTPQ